MANKNTKRNRPYKGYKAKGPAINSTQARKDSGRQAFDAPTNKVHPVSGLNTQEMRKLQP